MQSRPGVEGEFQRVGAAMETALSPPPPPSSLLGLGSGEKISVGRTEPANPGVTVRRGLVVEGFTGEEEEEFEVDVLWDGEPVEVLKVGGDTVTRVGVSEEAGCRILDV